MIILVWTNLMYLKKSFIMELVFVHGMFYNI